MNAPTLNLDQRELLKKQKRMVELSCELNFTADLDTMLQIIMDAATELTASEAASVLLVDPRTRDLTFAAASHSSRPNLIGMQVPRDNSIAGAILKSESPLIVSDVRRDPRHHAQVGKTVDYEIRSLLGVPMVAAEHKVGVLEAINKYQGEFSQEDVETLATLANLAAIAIHKAGLIAQLRDANEQLSQLDQLKSNFIAIASHELRTPLSVILGYASMLKEQVGGEELEQVLGAALQLRNLMDDIFNLQYIDAGKPDLRRVRFCLAHLSKELVEEHKSLFEAKEQSVRLYLPEHNCDVIADRDSVRLVLINLISNAIKFTPASGHIDIAVSARADEVWVSVKDNGVGIPEVLQKRIFDRFFQAEPHLTRREGGLGLGLAIARELLELQNGRIWLESVEGRGSIFTFALPTANPQSTKTKKDGQ